MSSEIEKIRVNGFRSRLAQLIGQQKPFEWAKTIGIPSSTFDRIWNHNAIPRPEHLLTISQKLNVSIDWLLLGATSDTPKWDRDALQIPFLKPKGNEDGVMLSRRLLPAICDDRELKVVSVKGDSMTPTIADGDFVVVDTSRTTINNGLFVLGWSDELHVRRLNSHPGGVTIINDNREKYTNTEILDDDLGKLTIVGEVIWISRSMG